MTQALASPELQGSAALGPVEQGEEALQNLFGAQVLPSLDLSSLPESFQSLLGGDANPRDAAVQQEVLQFLQSSDGGAARRLLGMLIGEQEIGTLLKAAGDDSSPSDSAPELRGKLEHALRAMTTGRAKSEIVRNVAKLRFGSVATIRSEGPRVCRNDPCPCGSGRKFKNCCLAKSGRESPV